MSKRASLALIVIVSLYGCGSTQISPEMEALAAKRKGEKLYMTVAMDSSDNYVHRCGYARPHESVECSKNILMSKLEKKAKNYCGRFKFTSDIGWKFNDIRSLYRKVTDIEANIMCTG